MRRFSYFLLAACLCLPLVGCSGDAAAPADDAPATSEGGDAAGSGDSGDATEGSGSAETEAE